MTSAHTSFPQYPHLHQVRTLHVLLENRVVSDCELLRHEDVITLVTFPYTYFKAHQACSNRLSKVFISFHSQGQRRNMGREDLGNEGSIIVFGAVNKESCQKNICRSHNIISRKSSGSMECLNFSENIYEHCQ